MQKCVPSFFSRENDKRLVIGHLEVVTHFCVYDSLPHGTKSNLLLCMTSYLHLLSLMLPAHTELYSCDIRFDR